MNLKREQEFVSQYHFDARNFEWENENGAPETKVDVNFQLLQYDQENQVTSQVNHVEGRIVNEPSEFNQEEVETLARPCLNMLNRLTYEVTEIALDLPGINLEF